MTKLLSKEDILAADDRKFVDVDVPEWGGQVRVATIMAIEHDRWMAHHAKEGSVPEKFRLHYVALCCVDEDGKPIFNPKDAEALGAKSQQAVDRLFKVAADLNGLSLEAAEGLEKNSEAGQSAGSSSESPGV